MKKLFLVTLTLLFSPLYAMQQPQEQNDALSILPGTPSQHPNRESSPSPESYEIPPSQVSQQSSSPARAISHSISPYPEHFPVGPLFSPERRQNRKREIENLSQTSMLNQDIQKHPRHEMPKQNLGKFSTSKPQNDAVDTRFDNQPLFDAIARRDIQFIRQNKKRSLFVKNKQGDTPLHEAVRLGHREIVQLLLDQGADPCEPNNDNLTSVELARHIVETTQKEIDAQQDYDMYNASNCQPILDLLTRTSACPSLDASSHNIPLHQEPKQKEPYRKAIEKSGSTYDYLSDEIPQKNAEKTGTSQKKK